MLVLYLLLLAALALLTAYTRNFQRTILTLAGEVEGVSSALLTPRGQWLLTGLLLLGWPAVLALGFAFIAWWKTVALVVGAFVVLVPALGSLTPRAMAAHYQERIRAEVQRRIAHGGRDAADLRRVLARLDGVGAPGLTRSREGG